MCRLVSRAGGRLRLPKGCEGLEVSPTVSYSGEGLRAICRGRTFRQAHDVFLQVCPHLATLMHPQHSSSVSSRLAAQYLLCMLNTAQTAVDERGCK